MDAGALGIYMTLFLALYFEVFLMISFLEKRPSPKSKLLPRRYPTVSIIVPVWNEEKTLAGTLNSLLKLDYPKDKLDILVVNDGSTDKTPEVASAYAAEFPAQIRLISKENGGKHTALNLGITESKAELVGCLDADSYVTRDALIEVVKKFEDDPETKALMPVMQVHKPRRILERMQSVEYTFGVFFKKMFDNMGALNVLPGPFSIYKREIFDTIGLFRPAHNTEDMEIAFRMHKHGMKIGNAHTALVYTTVPKTVRALLKQRTRWSQGFLQNSRDYKYMYLNPKYGNFGMFTLPIGLVAFFSGLYTATYLLYMFLSAAVTRVLDIWLTQVPPQMSFSLPELDWFYINTSMMTFLIIIVFSFTLTAIFLGKRISGTKIDLLSYISYFALFGFIAPIWLARAVWGAALARQSKWR